MKEGDKICIVREMDVDPVTSENTSMVAALVTLGVPFYETQPFLETREITNGEEKRTMTWCLGTKTEDGRFKTCELIQWWKDDAWCHSNPDHPLSYAKAAVTNFQRLTAGISTSVPVALVRKGKKFALIPFDAPSDRRQQLLDALNK